jgi:hypothetical protein
MSAPCPECAGVPFREGTGTAPAAPAAVDVGEVYVLRTVVRGRVDVELFSEPLSDRLVAALHSRVAAGALASFEVRAGYLNGGDTTVVHHGRYRADGDPAGGR